MKKIINGSFSPEEFKALNELSASLRLELTIHEEQDGLRSFVKIKKSSEPFLIISKSYESPENPSLVTLMIRGGLYLPALLSLVHAVTRIFPKEMLIEIFEIDFEGELLYGDDAAEFVAENAPFLWGFVDDPVVESKSKASKEDRSVEKVEDEEIPLFEKPKKPEYLN